MFLNFNCKTPLEWKWEKEDWNQSGGVKELQEIKGSSGSNFDAAKSAFAHCVSKCWKVEGETKSRLWASKNFHESVGEGLAKISIYACKILALTHCSKNT